MVLSSSVYFIFLAGIFLLYWPLARWRRISLAVILFANYFFYAKWDLFYLWLIPAASSCDFLIGTALGRFKRPWLRRGLVLSSVLVNLGILASFKYMPFLLANYSGITGRTVPDWHWTFPLGISFYCFQALTYTIDIYRKDAKPSPSYLTYLSAVSFFPTTLAGPINRVATLIPQFDRKDKTVSSEEGGRALFLISMGLMKKLLIADYLADNLVNRVFDLPKLYTATEVLIGVYGYALQIYYDFSGYTDIALGSALLLGIKLPRNFNMPYAAVSIADFWRRWHISLSNWLRDYLYFSLPGKRTRVGPYISLIITMTLGGLWHGASWNFAAWGLMHGLGLAVQRGWHGWRKPSGSRAGRIFATFLTVQFVCFTWIFFRAPDWNSAMVILERIGSRSVSFENISYPVAFVLMAASLFHYLPDGWYMWTERMYVRFPFYVQAVTLMLLAIALQYVSATGAAPFIYTKF